MRDSEERIEVAKDGPRGVHDMARGSIRRHVLRMMLFIITGHATQSLYSLVDMYWVSKLGREAIAAVALSSNLTFIALALTQMLSVACIALISRAAGCKDHAEVRRLFNQAQSLAASLGMAFLIVCLALSDIYAERLGGDARTVALSKEFLLRFIPALALQFMMVGISSALRAIGNMKPGLVAQILSILLNMGLAPFLVFGWIGGHPLGVAGAALSTLISTAAAVLGLVIYVARGKTFFRLQPADWRPVWRTWGRMLNIGLPSGVEFLLLSIIMIVIFGVVRPFGPAAQAGVGIGWRIIQAGFIPAIALSISATTVVGQNVGARDHARVREAVRESAKLAIALMLVFAVVCHFAAEPLVGSFTSEAAVVELGADYLRTVAYSYVASGLVYVVAGVFQGLGNTWPSLLASVTRAASFVIAALWLAQHDGFAIHTLWIMSVTSVMLQLAVCLVLLNRELQIKAPVAPIGGRR